MPSTWTSRARRRRRIRVAIGLAVIASLAATIAIVVVPALAPADAQPSGLAAELAYVDTHWSERAVAEYGSLGHNDCANFASQALVARGWSPDADWWHDTRGGEQRYSRAWIGSTSMAAWLGQHPDWARPLDDSERDEVRAGDLVQFDWDDSGNRDHTGIVTRVEHRGGRVRILYDSHSNDRHDFSVDAALKLGGGSAYYWHLTR